MSEALWPWWPTPGGGDMPAHDTVREALVDDLASGRLHRFDRENIEVAVDCLLERATEREVRHETSDYAEARGI